MKHLREHIRTRTHQDDCSELLQLNFLLGVNNLSVYSNHIQESKDGGGGGEKDWW